MRRRGAPEWFTHGKTRERVHRWWPWVLSSTCASLYFVNREPFDEAAAAVVTRIRRPLLRTTEWIEVHDVDPETAALELPPETLFGPLEFAQQMRFLLAALRADNELADGYLARVLVDHADFSLDPPLLREEAFVRAHGKELLEFAIDDFVGTRDRGSAAAATATTTDKTTFSSSSSSLQPPPPQPRRHIFFSPDTFLRLINMIAPYAGVGEWFVQDKDGVALVLRALKHSHDPFAHVLATRALTLFAFTQAHDGDVERRILQCNGMRALLAAYRQSTGDPTETRYVTLLLSSILRHFPVEGGAEFVHAGGVQAAVDNLNVSRYKGVPQHLRVLRDVQALPRAALDEVRSNNTKSSTSSAWSRLLTRNNKNSNNNNNKNKSSSDDAKDKSARALVNAQIEDANFVGVAMGVLDAFPEYYEVMRELLRTLTELVPAHAAPLDLLEHRAMPILAKLYVRWRDDVGFQTDGTRELLTRLLRVLVDDATCRRCLDPAVASRELLECVKTARVAFADTRTPASASASAAAAATPAAVVAAAV